MRETQHVLMTEQESRITVPTMIFDGREGLNFTSLHNNPLVVELKMANALSLSPLPFIAPPKERGPIPLTGRWSPGGYGSVPPVQRGRASILRLSTPGRRPVGRRPTQKGRPPESPRSNQLTGRRPLLIARGLAGFFESPLQGRAPYLTRGCLIGSRSLDTPWWGQASPQGGRSRCGDDLLPFILAWALAHD
ncbi:hypothetical protein Cgig2_033524 [Carnegiea gigantea]|uniref:Uncharacterized protein n=1 Tax=Carnegiea gigantea TaxID=171969 RepID=A0A9Q1JFM0_9CARY|nr:hypothetical protein Cgig2_033524 [Carnegiea gigantea]